MGQTPLQWPNGGDVCSGFWLYEPYVKERTACRHQAHGLEPENRQTVVGWVQRTLNSDFDSACRSGHSTPAGLAELEAKWDHVDAVHAHGVLLTQQAAMAWDITCKVEVWNNPPYISQVSEWCPLVVNKGKFDKTLAVADKLLLPANDLGRRNRCTTCDELPARTPSERTIKVKCHMSVLTCPIDLIQINNIWLSCGTGVDWAKSILENPLQAARALSAIAYNTLFLKTLNDRFSNEFSMDDKASVQRMLLEYRGKLPLIADVFKVYENKYSENFRARLAEVLNIIVLL